MIQLWKSICDLWIVQKNTWMSLSKPCFSSFYFRQMLYLNFNVSPRRYLCSHLALICTCCLTWNAVVEPKESWKVITLEKRTTFKTRVCSLCFASANGYMDSIFLQQIEFDTVCSRFVRIFFVWVPQLVEWRLLTRKVRGSNLRQESTAFSTGATIYTSHAV